MGRLMLKGARVTARGNCHARPSSSSFHLSDKMNASNGVERCECSATPSPPPSPSLQPIQSHQDQVPISMPSKAATIPPPFSTFKTNPPIPFFLWHQIYLKLPLHPLPSSKRLWLLFSLLKLLLMLMLLPRLLQLQPQSTQEDETEWSPKER